MEKNTFLIINDLIYHLYNSQSLEQLKKNFLMKLNMLIPYSYASILLADQSYEDEVHLTSPICCPDYFTEAEETYIRLSDKDYLLWNLHARESTLVKESDVIADEKRLNAPVYQNCYRKYNIYDSLQYTIVFHQKMLGVITLYRTKVDGDFSNDEMFFLRSLGMHLNASLYRILNLRKNESSDPKENALRLRDTYQLTPREVELLSRIFAFKSNEEIASELNIQENTVQKHMQNIFRKMNVSSKWELLRFL
ncbi:MAG: helix-turn-helix transcriptional regulator [Fusicatenibacter sp.]|nr:helix-turn-helix transcriptional regulator [Fusicatenibacter sp.]